MRAEGGLDDVLRACGAGGGGGALSDEGVSRAEEGMRIFGVGIHHFNLGSQTLTFFIYFMAPIGGCSMKMSWPCSTWLNVCSARYYRYNTCMLVLTWFDTWLNLRIMCWVFLSPLSPFWVLLLKIQPGVHV